MVQIETTILTLTVGIALFFFGMYVKKKGYWLSLSGSLIVMILGILLFFSPILFKSGATIDSSNPTSDVITYSYSSQDSTMNLILAWVFMLVGFFGIIISSINIYNLRFEGFEDPEIS